MRLRFNSFSPVLAIAFVGAMPLGGCAGLGDGFTSQAFIDPARYDLYDCERLKTIRAALVKEADAKQALIDKAKTGTGGAVIGEAVYRSDYVFARAQKKSADEIWQRNGCDAQLPPDPPAALAAKPKR